MKQINLRVALVGLGVSLAIQGLAVDFPGPTPGKARAVVKGEVVSLGNQALDYRWSSAGGTLKPSQLKDRLAGRTLALNSLMNQGFAHARYGSASECGQAAPEIRRELRSLFAGGTCLQELYVTLTMMSPQNWDDLAEAAKWAHRNSDILVDTHWIGGNPEQAQVYGWASWARRKGILALRNPAAQPASIALDIGQAFELPPRAPKQYRLKSPWPEDAAQPTLKLQAGKPHTFQLTPFEVLVFDAVPGS